LLSNVAAAAGVRSRDWTFHFGNHRRSITQRHEHEAIVPAETLSAPYRLKKKERKKIALGECTGARTKTNVAATIVAMKNKLLLQPGTRERLAYHSAPRNKLRMTGRKQIDAIVPLLRDHANLLFSGGHPGATGKNL